MAPSRVDDRLQVAPPRGVRANVEKRSSSERVQLRPMAVANVTGLIDRIPRPALPDGPWLGLTSSASL